MDIVIRKMVKEDTKNVQNIAQTSWHATYEGIIPRQIQDNFLQAAYSDEMMARRLSHSHMFVAEIDAQVVGFANYSRATPDRKIELSAIYLDPNYQGKGIGSALLQEGIRNIGNIREVHVEVEKENKTGLNFYAAKGFEKVHEYEDVLDGHILQTVKMKKKLKGECE